MEINPAMTVLSFCNIFRNNFFSVTINVMPVRFCQIWSCLCFLTGSKSAHIDISKTVKGCIESSAQYHFVWLYLTAIAMKQDFCLFFSLNTT